MLDSVLLKEWYTLAILLVVLFSLIGIAEKLRSTFNRPLEVTRKFVHVITGVLIFFTPYLFISSIPLILLAILFTVINYIAIKFNLFKGMHGTKRPTYGTVYYPLAFLILLLLFWPGYKIIVQLSMLILAFADAFAAIIGEQIKQPHKYFLTKDPKSLEGSATMAIVTFAIVFFGLEFLEPNYMFELNPIRILWIALLVSLLVTVAEAVSVAGSDNITVPLSAGFVIHFALTNNLLENIHFSVGVVLAFIVAVLSIKFRFLNKSGAAATFLLGAVVFGIGGWIWGVPILTFFISSSILSKLWKNKKKSANLLYEKSSKRDYEQVLANGGIPAIAILLFYVTGNQDWFLVYLAALAAVTADTWATETGALSKIRPRLITTFRQTDFGTSGAISWIGTLGSLLGSLFIALVGFLMHPTVFQNTEQDILIITFAGLVAGLIDSLIGATIQAHYKCNFCNKITEKKLHCNQPTLFLRGFVWMNNDLVNLICALAGFLIVFFVKI